MKLYKMEIGFKAYSVRSNVVEYRDYLEYRDALGIGESADDVMLNAKALFPDAESIRIVSSGEVILV